MKTYISQILILLFICQCNNSHQKQTDTSVKEFSQEDVSSKVPDNLSSTAKILSQWRGPNRDGIYPEKKIGHGIY